ncbi:helix-turn-helix domain-containing protein [Plantibacter sp. Mn2098]|uniref:helix-turn-helix domain-containing protein n=1 Tax=Plantibacter sp. Mn2098 TaxID=3395266 RepID=UPI003BE9FFFE
MTTTRQTAIVLESFPLAQGERFDDHVHNRDQLAWAREGVLMVTIGGRHWVLPSSLALWIPAGTWHTTTSVRPGTLQGIYLDPGERRGAVLDRPEPTVVTVSNLLRELIDHLCTDLDDGERSRAEHLVPDLLHPVDTLTIDLPLPVDGRARKLAEALIDDPADGRDLAAWGRMVGASTRTLSRIFANETGMGFTQWRTLLRLRAALGHLSEGDSVSQASARVGYSSASAFIASFRQVTGLTPGSYFAQLDADGGFPIPIGE